MKRVVLTSSIAAIVSPSSDGRDKLYSEADWNLDSTLDNGPYLLSKRLAEQAAWQFATAHHLNLVSINPGFVLGPPVSMRVDSTSVKFCLNVRCVLQGERSAGCVL